MQCLLDLIARRLPDRDLSETEWLDVLALAEDEHVLAWIAAYLDSVSSRLPQSVSCRVEAIRRDQTVAAFYWTSELRGVLDECHREAIAVVPLKGPFLAERLYGDGALRTSRDLDILVSKADLKRTEYLLARCGFSPGQPDDYHRPWYRGTTTVELHHDVENPLAFDFEVDGALLRARPAMFKGVPCMQLAPDDELLFLCLHGTRHGYERLSLILDVLLALERYPWGESGWNPRATFTKLTSVWALGSAMARRMAPELSVAIPNVVPERQRDHLERLAGGIWERLLAEEPEPRDWRSIHAFFLEMELPGPSRFRRRVRHLRILLTRVIGPDYAFALRFGLRRRWQVYLMRPLRMICERLHLLPFAGIIRSAR